METGLFEKIVDELEELRFSGRLSFHFYNEPLLRKDLETLIVYARQKLQLAYFVLYTNGDLLTSARYETLLKAGIDHFLVTRHSWDHFPERSFQSVQHPSNFAISGRGGSIAQANHSLKLACFGPSEMLIVTVNGDVVLCHEDADRKNVMGNLSREKLKDLWHSKRFVDLRASLELGMRDSAADICNLCDNRLYPLPGASI
jgi:GTP 3',8-cyclase